MVKPREQALVVKHNKLIESRYAITLQEKRILLWLLSEIKPDDTDFQLYRIQIKDLAEFAGIEKNKNIYTEMAGITKRLMERVLEISEIDSKRLLQVHWLSSADYRFGNGSVDLSFDPKLRPYLLMLKEQFTQIPLKHIISLSSTYSMRFYELLKQYQKIGTREIYIEELKKMIGVEGKYEKYRDFRRSVIEVAQREIRDKTDICFEFEEIKEGRKFASIRFTIFKNDKTEVEETTDSTDVLERLTKWHGMPLKEAKAAIEKLGEEKLRQLMGQVEEAGRKEELTKSALAFLRHLIKNTNPNAPTLFDQELVVERQKKEEAAASRKTKELEREQAIERRKELEARYKDYEQDLAFRLYESLPVEEQNDLNARYLAVMGNTNTGKKFRETGMSDGFVRRMVLAFLLSKKLLSIEAVSIEEFEAMER